MKKVEMDKNILIWICFGVVYKSRLHDKLGRGPFIYYVSTCRGEGGPKIQKMWWRNIWMVPSRQLLTETSRAGARSQKSEARSCFAPWSDKMNFKESIWHNNMVNVDNLDSLLLFCHNFSGSITVSVA